MSSINVGSRQVIINAEGKVVGTFLPSKKHFGKMAVTMFQTDGTPHLTIKGQEDWLMIQERNPDWTFQHSYYTVQCKKDGSDVVIQLTHSTVSDWNSTYRVPHEMNWSKNFLDQFILAQRLLGRETHIANFASLTV